MAQQSAGALVQPVIILLVLGFFLLIFVIPQFDFIPEMDGEETCYMETSVSLRTLENLKYVENKYMEKGEYEQALHVLKEVHKIQSETFGPEDKGTVTALEDLAGLNVRVKEYDEALALYWHVYKIKIKVLGPTHSEILNTLQKLAQVHHKKGNYGKALGFLKVIYKQRKMQLGPEHVKTMETLFLLGISLEESDQSPGTKQKVLKYYKKVYKAYNRTWGQNEETLTVLNEIGKCLVGLKRFEKAVPIFQTVLKKKLQPDSDSDLDSSGSTDKFLGWSLLQLGRMKEAGAVYQKAASLNSNSNSKQVDSSARKMGSILKSAKVSMAEENYEEALEKLEQLYSTVRNHEDHPKTEEILQEIIRVHDNLNNFKQAFERSMQLFHVVQNKFKSGAKCLGHKGKMSIASAWDSVFNQFLLILEKHPKLDSEETEILLPEFFKIVDFVVADLRQYFHDNDNEDGSFHAQKNPVVLKALAMAAFLAEEQEIATSAAAKLVRILKRQRQADKKSKRSEIDEKKNNSKINKEINMFQKMLNVKKLWGNINKKEF